MEDKNKIQIGVFIGIAALALIGLVYAILSATMGQRPASEAGLSQVCWNDAGLASYDLSECASSEAQEIRWPDSDIPLSVRATGTTGEIDTLTSAISLINDQVGCQLLELSDPATSDRSLDVLVSFGVPMTSGQDHPGGSVQFRRDALQRQTAYVDVYASALNADMLHKVLAHELGHVLGLAHDDWDGSIMRPMQTTEVGFVRLSDYDQNLLAEMYCAD